MNRLCQKSVIVLALIGSAAVGVYAQRQRATPSPQDAWQAERAFHLNLIMERARANYRDTLVKIEIGTMAPIDARGTQEALAEMEALVKADAARTGKPAPWIGTRRQLAELLDALDAADVRFQNGIVSTKDMSDAYLEIVKLLVK